MAIQRQLQHWVSKAQDKDKQNVVCILQCHGIISELSPFV
jgi:hypothetical protein